MNRLQHIQLMARYNQWMNDKLYTAAASLPVEQVNADRQAFFGSILGTLNHLCVADIIWLKRFARHPTKFASLVPVADLDDPLALNQQMFRALDEMVLQRRRLDQVIVEWAAELREDDLDTTLRYVNTAGIAAARNCYGLLVHLFNHQTHHRGQATTLLTQAGVDVGSTDVLALIPDLD